MCWLDAGTSASRWSIRVGSESGSSLGAGAVRLIFNLGSVDGLRSGTSMLGGGGGADYLRTLGVGHGRRLVIMYNVYRNSILELDYINRLMFSWMFELLGDCLGARSMVPMLSRTEKSTINHLSRNTIRSTHST